MNDDQGMVRPSLLKAQADIKYDALTIQITVSIGIASVQHPPPDFGIDSLMRVADQALYVAKQSGRNRVVAAGDNLSAAP